MSPVPNKQIIFKEFPTYGLPIPGQTTVLETSKTIDLNDAALNGGILIKTLVLSLEPFIAARMREYLPIAYKIGDTVRNYGVGIVLRSENPDFKVGDHVYSANFLFAEYSIQENTNGFEKIDNKHNLPWSVFVGIAGMPGMTAYFGWKEHAHAKKGEVAFVTSGAGAVGSLVIQLAKRDGMKVIASAGSDEKVEFLKELGADVAFNYKTSKTADVLAKEGPIDVYWDNVGGETLEAALNAAAQRARFIECGMLSVYGGNGHSIPNLLNVVVKELSINGFVINSLIPKYGKEFMEEVPALLASKELKYKEDVTKGLDYAMEAFVTFMKGGSIGKSIVIVADE